MTDLEKLSKFSQEDVKRVSEELGMKYQDIVIIKLPRQNFILLVVNLAPEKAPQ